MPVFPSGALENQTSGTLGRRLDQNKKNTITKVDECTRRLKERRLLINANKFMLSDFGAGFVSTLPHLSRIPGEERERGRAREREGERGRERGRGREREGERGRERQRQIDRQTDRQTDRQMTANNKML